MNKSYYAIIPANVRYDKGLNPNAKLLYGEITALSNEKGFCWASNSYFSELYDVSNRTIIRWINDLVDKNYIKTEIIYKKNSKEVSERRLWITNIIPSDNNDIPSCQNCHEPSDRNVTRGTDRNVTDNNTLFNNTFNNTENKRNNVEKASTSHLYCKEIVDYLNLKTGSQFRYTTKKTQTLIKTKLKDKYTIEDFKKVIDIKTYQWINDSKMKSYLRPETLFGSKFESYLNEWGSAKNEVIIRTDANGIKRDRLGLEIL